MQARSCFARLQSLCKSHCRDCHATADVVALAKDSRCVRYNLDKRLLVGSYKWPAMITFQPLKEREREIKMVHLPGGA